MRSASRAAIALALAKVAIGAALAIGIAFAWAAFSSAHSKTWDRDAILSEQGRIRHEYLSKAGTLPTYRDGHPTGETYHGNCCGEADAYEADEVLVDADGNTWAILTCNDQDNCREVCGGEDDDGAQICKVVRPVGSR